MNIAKRKRASGIVLMAVLLIIFALAVLAATISVMAVTDIKMTAHFKRATEALYEADAAVQYVKVKIQEDLRSGNLTLAGAKENVNYTAPNGMFFDPVTQLIRTGDTNAYFFVVTGYSDKARVTVETVFRRASTFDLGLFGDDSLDIKNSGDVFVYDSRIVSVPKPEDSVGGGRIASNGEFSPYMDAYIDGSVEVSNPDEVVPDASEEGAIITGEPGVVVDYIDPDPLGAIGGDLAADFAYYSVTTNNDNSLASPEITNPKKVWVKSAETMTLTSGDYYMNDLILFNGATLNIDASSGPVNIYIADPGRLEAKEGSMINFIGDGEPTDLNIFSNSDESIILKNGGAFKGLVYAPYASVQILNTADFYGIVWGGDVEIKNSGNVYIDIALMQKHLSNVIQLLTWKERREG